MMFNSFVVDVNGPKLTDGKKKPYPGIKISG